MVEDNKPEYEIAYYDNERYAIHSEGYQIFKNGYYRIYLFFKISDEIHTFCLFIKPCDCKDSILWGKAEYLYAKKWNMKTLDWKREGVSIFRLRVCFLGAFHAFWGWFCSLKMRESVVGFLLTLLTHWLHHNPSFRMYGWKFRMCKQYIWRIYYIL